MGGGKLCCGAWACLCRHLYGAEIVSQRTNMSCSVLTLL